jgi:hypothetical protein
VEDINNAFQAEALVCGLVDGVCWFCVFCLWLWVIAMYIYFQWGLWVFVFGVWVVSGLLFWLWGCVGVCYFFFVFFWVWV